MKAKFIVSFLLAFVISYAINAQSVYRLKYKSPHANDSIMYDAFFAIYDNGSGFVRISYLPPGAGKNVWVELEIQEQYAMNKEGVTDTTQLVYEGVNPIFIPDNSALSFIPVTFWFKMDPENKRYEPRAVTATAGDDVSSNTNLLSAELLMDKDHIKEVASRFFTKKDEYYKNLTTLGSRGGATLTETERKTKMFLLIVASTYDKEIGLSCLIDARKAIATFDSVSKFLGISKNMIVDSIYGDKFNKKNVDAAIERLKLKPGPGDIVVFYYSGHGFTNPEMNDKNFPFMDLRDPRLLKDSNLIRLRKVPRAEEHTMNIEDIYERIKKMPGRFKLVISDCCNDRILYKNVKAPAPPQPPRVRGEEKWNFDNAKTLFMSKERLALLMTAASKGERATSNDNYGGFFTNNFLSSLKTYLLQSNRNANWARIMADAQKLTIFQAKRTYCPLPENPKNICHQTPLSPKIN